MSKEELSNVFGMHIPGMLSGRMKSDVMDLVPAEPLPPDNRCAMLLFMLHHVMVERN